MDESRHPPTDAPVDATSDAASTIDLVERVRQGDRTALDRLFARHAPALRRWAAGRLPQWARDVTDTDDLVQDALLKTFRRIEDFDARGTGALNAYLRQVVLNGIRDELRRKACRPDATDLDESAVDHAPSPLEQAIGREALDRYELALSRLKPDEQEALVARMELGYTYEELAAVVNRPTPEAARKAVQRALVKLVAEMDRLRPAGTP